MAHMCQLWTKSVKDHWVILSNTCHSGHPNIKRPHRKIESTNFDQLKYTFCRSTKMMKKSQLRHSQTLTRWTGRVCSPTFIQLFCFFDVGRLCWPNESKFGYAVIDFFSSF